MEIKEMSRKDANIKILDLLASYILKYPDMRFCQALQNVRINNFNGSSTLQDNFYEESVDTLTRVKLTIGKEFNK